MHIVALLCGILGLFGFPAMVWLSSPVPLILGVAVAVVAIVTGALSRSQKPGQAGLVLGGLGLFGTVALFFLLFSANPT